MLKSWKSGEAKGQALAVEAMLCENHLTLQISLGMLLEHHGTTSHFRSNVFSEPTMPETPCVQSCEHLRVIARRLQPRLGTC